MTIQPGIASDPLPPPVPCSAVNKKLNFAVPTRVVPPARRASRCQPLSAEMCQCLAAKNSALANVLMTETWLQGKPPPQPGSCFCGLQLRYDELRRQQQVATLILGYSAQEFRNRSAGKALQGYYQLAGAEVQAGLLKKSLKKTADLLAGLEEMRTKGFEVTSKLEALQEKQNELHKQLVEAELGIDRLHVRLRLGLGLDTCHEPARLWPTSPVQGMFPTPPADRAIHIGLHHRADMNALRVMVSELDQQTLPVIRRALGGGRGGLSPPRASPVFGGVNPLLTGLTSLPITHGLCSLENRSSHPRPPICCLSVLGNLLNRPKGISEEDVECLRQKLLQLLNHRERQVVQEIREAILVNEARLRSVSLSHQRVADVEKKLGRLKERKEQSQASQADVTRAQLEVYQARGELLRAVTQWAVASAQLRQAMGVLILECEAHPCDGSTPDALELESPGGQSRPAPQVHLPTDLPGTLEHALAGCSLTGMMLQTPTT